MKASTAIGKAGPTCIQDRAGNGSRCFCPGERRDGPFRVRPTGGAIRDDARRDGSMPDLDAAAAYDLEYSDSYENIESVMFWPQNHMVAPPADALECRACHSEGRRLDFAALGFDDGRVAEFTAFPPGPEPEPETTTTTAAPTTTTTEAPTTTTVVAAAEDVEDEPSSTGLVVGIIAGVVVLVGLGYMMLRRRTA